MIRGHVSDGSDFFMRNRVAILVMDEQDGFPHRRLAFIPGNGVPFGEPEFRDDEWVNVDSAEGTQAVSPYTLDVPRHVAKAVYDALGEVFAPKDPTPLASDRAYSDARTDIDRQHALLDKLVDVVARPPIVVNGTVVQSTRGDRP